MDSQSNVSPSSQSMECPSSQNTVSTKSSSSSASYNKRSKIDSRTNNSSSTSSLSQRQQSRNAQHAKGPSRPQSAPCSSQAKEIPKHWMKEGYLESYKPSQRIQDLAIPRDIYKWFRPDKKLNNDLSRPPPEALRIETSAYTKSLAEPRTNKVFYSNPVKKSPYSVKRSALTASASPHLQMLAVPRKEIFSDLDQCKKVHGGRMKGDYKRLMKLAAPRGLLDEYVPPRPLDNDLSRPAHAALIVKTTAYMNALAEPSTRAVFYSDPCLRFPYSVKSRALRARCSSHIKSLAIPRQEMFPPSSCKKVKKWTTNNKKASDQRILRLAQPKELSECYYPNRPLDNNLSRPTYAALNAKTSSYVKSLAKSEGKKYFYVDPCNPDAFSVKRKAKTAVCSKRTKILATPRQDKYKECTQPKKIPLKWTDSDYLRNYNPGKRTLLLANPKPLHKDYIPSKPCDNNLSRPTRAAKKAQTTEYVEVLAEPLNRSVLFYDDPCGDSPFDVKCKALTAKCTKRTKMLAVPRRSLPELFHGKKEAMRTDCTESRNLQTYKIPKRLAALANPRALPMSYIPPKPLDDNISRPTYAALNAKTTDYVRIMAQPSTKTVFYMDPCGDNPFQVKQAALRAKCTDHIKALAEPRRSLPDILGIGPHKPCPDESTAGSYSKNYKMETRIKSMAKPRKLPSEYVPPRHFSEISRPSSAAVRAKTTSYTKILAKHGDISQFYQNPLKEDPYSVKPGAIRAECSPRTAALAKHRMDQPC